MTNSLDPSHSCPADASGFAVYVLRDPRDGVVFFVGRSLGTGQEAVEKVDGIRSNEPGAQARERAIRDEGHEVELLIIASDLSDEGVAATVERAVVTAYEAAQFAPSSVIGAHHWPGSMSDRSLLAGPFNKDPGVQQAAAEFQRLSAALGRGELEPAVAASNGFLDVDHRSRLESVILQQESEMAQLNATLDRLRSLRDLAQWAETAGGGDGKGGAILIADLTRALG